MDGKNLPAQVVVGGGGRGSDIKNSSGALSKQRSMPRKVACSGEKLPFELFARFSA